jgi:hypothetical protein
MTLRAACIIRDVLKHSALKSYANRGLVCALGSCQFCGERSSVGAATSEDEFLPQIPRRGRRIRDLMSASWIVNLTL